jgi:hypothetical protein
MALISNGDNQAESGYQPARLSHIVLESSQPEHVPGAKNDNFSGDYAGTFNKFASKERAETGPMLRFTSG